MTLYERLCRLGERTPVLSSIASRRRNNELERASRFLRPIMSVTPVGVTAAAYLGALLTLVGILALSWWLALHLFLSVPIAAASALIVYYVISSYPISRMNSYRLMLSDEADVMFEQFLLVFQSGGTIFDAMRLMAESDHPYLSTAFQRMLAEVAGGRPPEKCLMEFASNQPSDDLRRYLIAIVSALERKTYLLESLSGESFEADLTLRSKNLELESRLLIVAAVITYAPMMFTMVVSLTGQVTSPMVMLLIPVLVGLNLLLRTRFSRAFTPYFDRPQETGLVRPSQREIVREYDEFLNLLLLIAERLRNGDTLEVALAEVRENAAPEVRGIVDKALQEIYGTGSSLTQAIDKAANQALGRRVAHLLRLTGMMCEFSAADAGVRLAKIVTRLIKRSAVAKERDSIIAAQRLKIYLLSLTSAIVLGLLSALSPFLSLASLFQGGGTPFGNTAVSDIMPLLITLGVVTVSAGYQNTLMVSGERPRLTAIGCGLAYWISFVMAASMIGVQIS
ncbi:MAG: hypothetical protein DRO73_02030 [Candidatus Thorarchaeota archaeon]|nr:MAG: hypothetical protein DRO73_02030 [Candidatus Thorarchaeota archaeon]